MKQTIILRKRNIPNNDEEDAVIYNSEKTKYIFMGMNIDFINIFL